MRSYSQMPQRSPYAQSASSVPVAALLGQVLGITGVGFLFTAVAAYLFRGATGFGWIPMIVTFALLFVMQAVRKQPAIALLVFYAFTFFEGIFIAPVIAAYARADGSAVVINAAATTGLGMLILGGVAFTFSIDWRRFSSIAFIALIALVVVSLIAAFTHFIHPQGDLVARPRRLYAAHADRLQPHPSRRRRSHSGRFGGFDLPRCSQHLPCAVEHIRRRTT